MHLYANKMGRQLQKVKVIDCDNLGGPQEGWYCDVHTGWKLGFGFCVTKSKHAGDAIITFRHEANRTCMLRHIVKEKEKGCQNDPTV